MDFHTHSLTIQLTGGKVYGFLFANTSPDWQCEVTPASNSCRRVGILTLWNTTI